MHCVEQEQIQKFLKKHKLEQHADKFKSWEHLMMSKRKVLKKVMEIPTADRKKIRSKVHTWKLNHYFRTGQAYMPTTFPLTDRYDSPHRFSSDDETDLYAPIIPKPSAMSEFGVQTVLDDQEFEKFPLTPPGPNVQTLGDMEHTFVHYPGSRRSDSYKVTFWDTVHRSIERELDKDMKSPPGLNIALSGDDQDQIPEVEGGILGSELKQNNDEDNAEK